MRVTLAELRAVILEAYRRPEEVKRCLVCDSTYGPEEWERLEYVGEQVFPAEFGYPEERMELRNCPCGTTLARRLASSDVDTAAA